MFQNLRSSQFLAPALVSLAGITAAPPSEAAQEPPPARAKSASPTAADTSLYSPLQLGNARISEQTPEILYEIANRIKTLRQTKEGRDPQALRDLTEALEKQLVALSAHESYLANFSKPPPGTLSEKRCGELLDLAIRAYWDLLKSYGKEGVEYRPDITNLDRIIVTQDFARKGVEEISTCSDTAQKALLALLARDTFPQTLRNTFARALLRSGIPEKVGSEPRTALVTTLGKLRVSDPAVFKEVADFVSEALADPRRVDQALEVMYHDEALGRAVIPTVHEVLQTCKVPALAVSFLQHLKWFDGQSAATIGLSQVFLDPAHPHAVNPQFTPARIAAYQILRNAEKLPQPLPKALEPLADADVKLGVALQRAVLSEKWGEAIQSIRLGADIGHLDLRGLADVCAVRGDLGGLKTLQYAGFDFSKTDQKLLAQGVFSGDPRVVRYLIDRGVPYIGRDAEAGVAAVEVGNPEILNLILSTYQGLPGQWGYIMAKAIQVENRAVFNELLAAGRVDMAAQGWLMVCHAAGNGDLELVKQLFEEIKKAGGDPAMYIGSGIGNAAYGGHVKVLQYLKEYGIDLRPHLSHAAQEALTNFRLETLKFLQQFGDIRHGCANAIRSTYLHGFEADAALMRELCANELGIPISR